MDPNNIFADEKGQAALNRLLRFKKTNINYNLVERFGLEAIQRDLNAALKELKAPRGVASPMHGTVRINLEDYVPQDLIRIQWYGNKTYKLHIPIMPLVLISIDN